MSAKPPKVTVHPISTDYVPRTKEKKRNNDKLTTCDILEVTFDEA